MDEERDLVQRIAAGDMKAYRLLIKKYQKLVSHMVYRLVHNQQDHDDLCQEIFTRIYFKIGTFRHQAKLSTWIATIAYHETINWLKKHRKGDAFLTEDPDLESYDAGLDTVEPGGYPKEDLHAIVLRMVELLPPVYRSLITLYHLEGFKYAEISSITGLPEGTVKSYLSRARHLLKKKILTLIPKEEIIWTL
jgi:RNA polymerase sigma-70 factor, ECF subfamily